MTDQGAGTRTSRTWSAAQPAKRKAALITGITDQDGTYLAEFLLRKRYIIHGLRRRASLVNTHRIDYLYKDPHHPNARLFSASRGRTEV